MTDLVTAKKIIMAEGHKYSVRTLSLRYGFSEYMAKKVFKDLIAEKDAIRNAKFDQLKEMRKKDKRFITDVNRREVPRICLKCDNKFMAATIYNRLCPNCSNKSKEIYLPNGV